MCTLSVEIDENGRLVCTIEEDGQRVLVTAASAASAVEDFVAALEAARADGYGECQWDEATGEYRWMFRRHGDQLTVVVLWSSGVITGWQHVFRSDCDFESFAAMVRDEFGQRGT